MTFMRQCHSSSIIKNTSEQPFASHILLTDYDPTRHFTHVLGMQALTTVPLTYLLHHRIRSSMLWRSMPLHHLPIADCAAFDLLQSAPGPKRERASAPEHRMGLASSGAVPLPVGGACGDLERATRRTHTRVGCAGAQVAEGRSSTR
jgi:hypothetical protein